MTKGRGYRYGTSRAAGGSHSRAYHTSCTDQWNRVLSHVATLTDGIFVARHARTAFRSRVWTLVPPSGESSKLRYHRGGGKIGGGTELWRERKRAEAGRVDERESSGGANPENVLDEDGDMVLSGRAEHQSGSRRTGASFSLSLFLFLFPPSPIAPSLFLAIIFLTSTLLVERQRNKARWRGESRLTTRRNATAEFSLQRSNRQAVWTFLSNLYHSSSSSLFFFRPRRDDNRQIRLKVRSCLLPIVG